MTNQLGGKTPAQTYNDLFYINNNNSGIDSTLRSVYSGNGKQSKLKLSTEKVEIDFQKGICKQPILDEYSISSTNIGTIPSTYEVKFIDGNIQMISVSSDVTITIVADLEDNTAAEITLLIMQTAADKKLSFNGNVKLAGGGGFLELSGDINTTDIVKLLTVDAGATWYAYQVAGKMS